MGAVLVTGAGGYLGTHVLSALRDAGREVVGLARREAPGLVECDLLDAVRLARLMEASKPDAVVHCAWETPQSRADYEDATKARSGLAMLDNLLAATSAPVIYISSMTVYGPDHHAIQRSESDAGHPDSAYGHAKWSGEQRLANSGRSGFAVRLPGLFGGSREGGLVYNVLHALKAGKAPELPMHGLCWAAMDVRDAAEAIARLCALPCEVHTPINIGYADVYSVSRLVEIAGELVGHPFACDVVYPDFAFDLSRARALGVAPKQTLRGACRRLLEETP